MTNKPTELVATQADRDAAADLLDEISSLLQDDGIGQVADLIRDGEYDEHDATQAFAAHRLASTAPASEDAAQPVAWMYSCANPQYHWIYPDRQPSIVDQFGRTETPLYAHPPAPASEVEAGWIVGNGTGDKWRAWVDGTPTWAEDREKATRYYSRADAEAVHAEDEDAWRIVPLHAALRPRSEWEGD